MLVRAEQDPKRHCRACSIEASSQDFYLTARPPSGVGQFYLADQIQQYLPQIHPGTESLQEARLSEWVGWLLPKLKKLNVLATPHYVSPTSRIWRVNLPAPEAEQTARNWKSSPKSPVAIRRIGQVLDEKHMATLSECTEPWWTPRNSWVSPESHGRKCRTSDPRLFRGPHISPWRQNPWLHHPLEGHPEIRHLSGALIWNPEN